MVLEKFAPVGMEKSTNRTTIKSKSNSSAQVVNNGKITTTPNSFKTSTLRRIKRLFLIYLKQFDIEEFKLMIKFLRFILNKYKLEPLKLFGIKKLNYLPKFPRFRHKAIIISQDIFQNNFKRFSGGFELMNFYSNHFSSAKKFSKFSLHRALK